MLLNTIMPILLVLSAADSKTLFDQLSHWKTSVSDPQNKTQLIRVSAVICSESLERRKNVGCSLFDELHQRDVTKNNKLAEALYANLSQHISAECDDDGAGDDTNEDLSSCLLSIDEIACTASENNYSCTIKNE